MKYIWSQNSTLIALDEIQSNATYNASYRQVVDANPMWRLYWSPVVLHNFSIESQLHLLHTHIPRSNTWFTRSH